MKAISETQLDIANDKLNSIKDIAKRWSNIGDQPLLCMLMKSILEVIDE